MTGEEHQEQGRRCRDAPKLVIASVQSRALGEGRLHRLVEPRPELLGPGPSGQGGNRVHARAQDCGQAGDRCQHHPGPAVIFHRRHVLEAVLGGVHEAQRDRGQRADRAGNPGRRHRVLQEPERGEPDQDLQCHRQRQYAQRQVQDEDVETPQKPDEFHQTGASPKGKGP
jgi:hypothetical protein